MKVQQLRRILERIPDDANVVAVTKKDSLIGIKRLTYENDVAGDTYLGLYLDYEGKTLE